MKNFLRFKLTALIRNVALLLAAGLTNAFANTVIDCASPTSTTQTVQSSLTECSIEGSTCEIPSGATCKVSGPLYMWGNASLKSSNGGGIEFTLNPTTPNQYPYLFNLGISGPQIPVGSISNLQNPFTGKIAGVTFKLTGTSTDHGRIIYFWRTDGATVSNNVFDVGSFNYSATSSGNNQAWVHNSDINSVRRNVTISNNIINATSAGDAPLGSEGIGLGQFTSATIQGNVIRGVGDDGIALHFCSGVKILDNVLETTRGRIFVGNSDHVEIARNKHTRIASLKDNRFYVGISLLYVGFEDVQGGPSTNQWYAPSDIDIHHNELYYPFGSIDRGAAIYLYAPRKTTVKNNLIVNNSSNEAQTRDFVGLHLIPGDDYFKSATGPTWADPTGLDPKNIPRVHDVIIDTNVSIGDYPLALTMTGGSEGYVGPITVSNNVGPAAGSTGTGSPGYQFYYIGQFVTAKGNKALSSLPAAINLCPGPLYC